MSGQRKQATDEYKLKVHEKNKKNKQKCCEQKIPDNLKHYLMFTFFCVHVV